MKYFPLAKPYITAEDRLAVANVLKTDQLAQGPKVLEFERQFAKKMDTRYACAVSSGTAGLHLALLASGVGPGDEVITTPFSFVASANSILYTGARPVFADIEEQTYNINPQDIEDKITRKTKAILVVHIFGQPCDMEPIMRVAKKYKLALVEDACEAIGAAYRGKLAGTFGQTSVFAFYPNKQMTTAEGGMIITQDKRINELCLSLRNQGRPRGDEWLNHERLGFNYRLNEMSAALGLSQLKKLDFLIGQRRKIAARYNQLLKPHADTIQAPMVGKSNTHSWFVYVVRLKSKKIDRDQVMKNLGKAGISTKPYLPSIHLQKFYKKLFGYRQGDFPVSEKISRESLALPVYIGLKFKDCKYIISKLLKEISP